jgi:hypothetical protein
MQATKSLDHLPTALSAGLAIVGAACAVVLAVRGPERVPAGSFSFAGTPRIAAWDGADAVVASVDASRLPADRVPFASVGSPCRLDARTLSGRGGVVLDAVAGDGRGHYLVRVGAYDGPAACGASVLVMDSEALRTLAAFAERQPDAASAASGLDASARRVASEIAAMSPLPR